MQSPPSSIIFSIGGFHLHYYGLIMFFAILCAILTMRFVAKKFYKAAETLLPAGTTIAYDQLSIRDYKAPELKLENQQTSNVAVIVPTIQDNDRNYLIVNGEDFTLEFNKHNGYLCRYDVNGMQLMEDGSLLTPNFWRAPDRKSTRLNSSH